MANLVFPEYTISIVMGFIVYEQKQHLNLSEAAWMIIDQDIDSFNRDESKKAKDGFLNRIIANFYQVAKASISLRLEEKEAELEELFSDNQFKNLDPKLKKAFINKSLDKYKDELLSKALSYPSGPQRKMRINNENASMLQDDSLENEYYDNRILPYLKALIEEYCELPPYIREQIYFKQTIDIIQMALKDHRQIKFSLYGAYDLEKKAYSKKRYYISPYKIVQDQSMNYNYLVGYSYEANSSMSNEKQTEASYRLSRIIDPVIMQSKSGRLSEEKKLSLEKALNTKRAPYLAGDIEKVIVKFTPKGYSNFTKQLYGRPPIFHKVEGEELTYVFECTEFQAYSYFLKFVHYAEIISPTGLRNRMLKDYQKAVLAYLKEEKVEENK